MSQQITEQPESQPAAPEQAAEEAHGWKHWGLMVLCCLPMLAVLVLIILGVWGAR